MAITGAPEAMMVGGATSQGPAAGIYRCKITDAGVTESSKTGRKALKLTFFVDGDKDHPSKNGKKLVSKSFWGASKEDDAEKVKMMNGMLKRQLYVPLEIPWPKEGKAADPRIFSNKICYVVISPEKNKESGDIENTVTAIALKREKLPKSALDGSLFKKKDEKSAKAESEDVAEEQSEETSSEEQSEETEAPKGRRR